MKPANQPSDTAVRLTLMRMFLEATALGDALGATTEFQGVHQAIQRTEALRPSGFPFVPAGGGWLNLAAGMHTDDTDMAIAIAQAFVASGHTFNASAIVEHWQVWLATHPPDVGMLTRQVLGGSKQPEDLYATSRNIFLRDPQRAPNGALMRNAIICAMAPDLKTAFEWSLKQGILTHYHPLSVLCCAVQVWLIWETFENRWPFDNDVGWLAQWQTSWTNWAIGCQDVDVQAWKSVVEKKDILDDAMADLCHAEFDASVFDPFKAVASSTQGWVLLSLQVAVWAMQWSRRSDKEYPFAISPELEIVEDIFSHRGHQVVGWIPLIGRDADTYGAIAGPMIAAAVGQPFPQSMFNNLHVRKSLNFLGE